MTKKILLYVLATFGVLHLTNASYASLVDPDREIEPCMQPLVQDLKMDILDLTESTPPTLRAWRTVCKDFNQMALKLLADHSECSMPCFYIKPQFITAENIVELNGFTNLNCLSFEKADDSHFGIIAQLTNLKDLQLTTSSFTAKELPNLARLTGLRCLSLESSSCKNGSFECLSGLTDLFNLQLKLPFSDEACPYLAGLTKMNTLSLESNAITDSGLSHLHGFTKLNGLILQNTQVTEEGTDQLKEILPNLGISAQRKIKNLLELELTDIQNLVRHLKFSAEEWAQLPQLIENLKNMRTCESTDVSLRQLCRFMNTWEAKEDK